MKYLMIWIKNPIPSDFINCFKTFERFLDSNDELQIITDRDIPEFRNHTIIDYNQYLSNRKELEAKSFMTHNIADYLRYYWLSQNEGAYIDIDYIHFADYHDLPFNNLSLEPNGYGGYHNGFIISKNKDLFKRLISKLDSIEKFNGFHGLYNAFNEELKGLKIDEFSYEPLNYEQQCDLWRNENETEVIDTLMSIYRSHKWKGIGLQRDPYNPKPELMTKYVNKFIDLILKES